MMMYHCNPNYIDVCWLPSGPPRRRGPNPGPTMMAASMARLEAVAAAGLRALSATPAASLDPAEALQTLDPATVSPQPSGALSHAAAVSADGAALGAAAALLSARCRGCIEMALVEAQVASAAEGAAAGAGKMGAPARVLQDGGREPEPKQAEPAGPLLGSLGGHLRRAAAFLAPCSGEGLGLGVGSCQPAGLPLGAVLRAVAFLEAAGRALGCYELGDAAGARRSAAGCSEQGTSEDCGARAGVAPGAKRLYDGGCVDAGTPASAAFEALLALHLRLLRALPPPPQVAAQA